MSGNTHADVLLAGAFAAFSVDLLIYPLDTVKTRLQSPHYKQIYYNASQTAINKSVLFRGLYQGIGSVILITIPSSGAFFTTYEGVKSVFKNVNPTLSGSAHPLVPQPFIDSAASAIAELVSCFILTPAEVLKQNAQMIQRSKRSPKSSTIFQPSVTLEVLKHFRKPTQLWRGYTALAARNLPFTAMQFPMFEQLKRSTNDYRQQDGTATGSLLETAVITAISAGAAGSVAAVITTPVDVVKTRIMLSAAGDYSNTDTTKRAKRSKVAGQSASSVTREKGVTAKSGITVAREVLKENGVRSLFRGGLLRGIWTALGSALYLGIYESGRHFLEDRHKPDDR